MALHQLTNFWSQGFSLEAPDIRDKIANGSLWRTLKYWHSQRALMACHTTNDKAID
jgi:hypothetical protein